MYFTQSLMNHIAVDDSPSVHHQSTLQRQEDLPEHTQGPAGPVEENAGRKVITFLKHISKLYPSAHIYCKMYFRLYLFGTTHLRLEHLNVHIWHVYWIPAACKSVLKSYLWFNWMGPIKIEMSILRLYCHFWSFFN